MLPTSYLVGKATRIYIGVMV